MHLGRRLLISCCAAMTIASLVSPGFAGTAGEGGPTGDPYLLALAAEVGGGTASVLMPDAVGARVSGEPVVPGWVVSDVDASQLRALAQTPYASLIAENTHMQAFVAEDAQPPNIVGSRAVNASGFDGDGWAVAVLDTGVEASHPYLRGQVVYEGCYTSNNGCPNGQNEMSGAGASAPETDRMSHGTHVAGIIAGQPSTLGGVEYRGVAPKAKIVALRVFSVARTNGFDAPYATDVDILKAMQWVLDNHTRFKIASINMSLGSLFGQVRGRECSTINPAMSSMVAKLEAAGVAVVIATGNAGRYSQISYPACIPGAVSVGATDAADAVAMFSDISADTDLLAPGVDVYSSVFGGKMQNYSGTSMATPVVAGAFAVLRQLAPDTPVQNLVDLLRSAGLSVDDTQVKDLRRLELDHAVAILRGHARPTAPSDVVATEDPVTVVTVRWSPVPGEQGIRGYWVRLGAQRKFVTVQQHSASFEVADDTPVVPQVASDDGMLTSTWVAGPSITPTRVYAAPSVRFIGGSGTAGNRCVRPDPLVAIFRITTTEPAVTDYTAWWEDAPDKPYSAPVALPEKEYQGQLEITDSYRESGTLIVVGNTPNGPTRRAKVNYVAYVWPAPKQLTVIRTDTGWKATWVQPPTPQGGALVKSRAHTVYVDGTVVGTVPENASTYEWADPDHTAQTFGVCLAGEVTYQQQSGEGPPMTASSYRSEVVIAPPKAVAPSRVSNVVVTTREDGALLVAWGPATAPLTAPVLRYVVSAGGRVITATAEQRSVALTDVAPGEALTVSVKAVSDAGEGPAQEVVATVSGFQSNDIRQFTGRATKDNGLALEWSVATRVHADDIQGFIVTVGDKGDALTLPASARALELGGLAPGPTMVTLRMITTKDPVVAKFAAYIPGSTPAPGIASWIVKRTATGAVLTWAYAGGFVGKVASIKVTAGTKATGVPADRTSATVTCTAKDTVVLLVKFKDGTAVTRSFKA